MKKFLLIALSLPSLVLSSSGAAITWQTAQDRAVSLTAAEAANDVVVTGGEVIAALNFGEAAGTTFDINGLTFMNSWLDVSDIGYVTSTSDNGGSSQETASGKLGTTSGDANYDRLLNTVGWSGNGAKTITYTFNGLTSGQDYQFQVWYNDSGRSTQTVTWDDTIAGSVDTLGAGQYAIGTFTASGTTQQLRADHSNSVAQWNAFTLQAIPEPASAGLFVSVAALALLCRRRSR